MIPPPFEYRAPDSLPEALALLREHGGDARLMAGGQSLLPMLKLRLVRPAVIIDIGGIRDLTGVTEDGDTVRIGALVTERTLERTLGQRLPLLAEAAASIGDIHIRNLGTLGGALSQADPSGDLAPAALALGATLNAQSTGGSRAIAARDFFTGPFETCLADDEIVTSVDVPRSDGVHGHAYVKMVRRAGDYAVVGAAALVNLAPDGTCEDARIALCAAGPTAFICEDAGGSLQGTRLTDADLAQAAALAGKAAEPVSDVHASAEYRKEMTPVVVARALTQARERAGRQLREANGR
ncbi:MAG: xanthine dehydrogenase family protein subunit M [Deltaproteobacteria bacterium]|nr:xanthine dehydrogenase family protein subunit M [Deltaproteobacteria bacterium]